MAEFRGDLNERYQHECPFHQAGMRNLDIGVAPNGFTVQQQVKIDRAGRAALRIDANSPKLALDLKQFAQQFWRRQICFHGERTVEIARLRRTHRVGFIERADRGQPHAAKSTDCGHRSIDGCSPVAEV